MARNSLAPSILAQTHLTPPLRDPLKHPFVQRLTRRYLERRARLSGDVVETTIELGTILLAARSFVSRSYKRWLKEMLHTELSTAGNYEALARLYKEEPRTIEQWKSLGPSKLYRLARISPRARRWVLQAPRIREMTDRDFMRLTKRYVVRKRRVSDTMRAHGLRMKVKAFQDALRQFPRAAEVEPRMRAGLRHDLRELSRTLRWLERRIS